MLFFFTFTEKKEELLYNIKRIYKKTKQRIILSMQIISER